MDVWSLSNNVNFIRIVSLKCLWLYWPISHYHSFKVLTLVFQCKLQLTVHFYRAVFSLDVRRPRTAVEKQLSNKSFFRCWLFLSWPAGWTLVRMMDRFLPPHRTCRAHTRPPVRKSWGHHLCWTQHSLLHPPS